MLRNDRFFILTGGPGVGKTSLLEELRRMGFGCVEEVAREIIKEQVTDGGNALPWGDTALYASIMHRRSVETYISASSEGVVFFDRGIPDTLSYIRLINGALTKEMDADAREFRYNQRVFILPPWPEIYETDSERKQDWEEAVRTYEQLQKTYRAYGYELIELPKASVEQRADFVLYYIY